MEHNRDDIVTPRIAKYFMHHDNIDWKSVYKRAHKIPLDTKVQEFQYKFLNDILINNYWLRNGV